MASARLSKDGKTYYIEVYCGRDLTGKKITASEKFPPTATTPAKIKKEVEKEKARFEEEIKKKGPKYTYTFRKLFTEDWREHYAKERLTQKQQDQYIATIAREAPVTLLDLHIVDIKTPDIQAIVDSMNRAGKAVSTIRKAVNCINSVFKYAMNIGLIQFSPCSNVIYPKSEVKEMECFNEDQVNRFLAFLDEEYSSEYHSHDCMKEDGTSYSVPTFSQTRTVSAQYKAFFTLAIYAGLRRNEALALTWDDVDFINHKISITKSLVKNSDGIGIKEPKTKAGTRTIPVVDKVITALKEWSKEQEKMRKAFGTAWIDNPRRSIFVQTLPLRKEDKKTHIRPKNKIGASTILGNYMDESTPYHALKKIIARYNEQCQKGQELPVIRLHDLRHTCASLLRKYGYDPFYIAKYLGHSDPRITLETYTHADEQKMNEMIGDFNVKVG